MYYNRNLITAEQHPTDGSEASGVFDLATQAYSQSKKDWPIPDDDFDVAFRIDPDNPVKVLATRHTLGPVTYTVDWGDGTAISTETDVTISHDYSSGGVYIIKITQISGATYALSNVQFAFELTGFYANSSYNASTGKMQFQDKGRLKFLAVPFGIFANVTDFNTNFRGCVTLEEFPLLDVSSGTQFIQTWHTCLSLRSFPALSFNSATDFRNTWERCYNLQTFPLITNTSNVTNFGSTWKDCGSLVSFPLIDTSGGTDFNYTWQSCRKLASFPSINTANGTTFQFSWQNCVFTTFPSLNFGSGTTFRNAWQYCQSLANFPADMFDSTGTLASNAFFRSFENCSLTAQSIENILTSLDTNGATGIELHIGGGSNASYSTWSQAAKDALSSLQGKSWSVTYRT